MMINHFYPIAYLGGSGGAFLSSWLNQAMYGIPLKLNTSTGNAHDSARDAGFGIFNDQIESIEGLKQKFTDTTYKMFIGCHIVDDSLLLSNFPKVTKITYDQDDALEIAINFYTKNPNLIDFTLEESILNRIESTKQFNDRMSKTLPETEQSTNVSWKALLYGDPDELVDKLANFYSIKKSNFDLANLVWWRTLAMRNIANAPVIKIGDAG